MVQQRKKSDSPNNGDSEIRRFENKYLQLETDDSKRDICYLPMSGQLRNCCCDAMPIRRHHFATEDQYVNVIYYITTRGRQSS